MREPCEELTRSFQSQYSIDARRNRVTIYVLSSQSQLAETYEGLMRISEYMLMQMAKTIVAENHKKLIEALPQEDDFFVSETLTAVPGTIFYHLQISRHPRAGHIGRIFRGFDSVELVTFTQPQTPEGMASARDDILDNQAAVFNVVLNEEC